MGILKYRLFYKSLQSGGGTQILNGEIIAAPIIAIIGKLRLDVIEINREAALLARLYPSRSIKYLRFQQADPLKKDRKHWGGGNGRFGRKLCHLNSNRLFQTGSWMVFGNAGDRLIHVSATGK